MGWALLLGAVAACAMSCAGPAPTDRVFPASEAVAVFTDAIWARDEAGRWYLVSAEWNFEPELSDVDVRYQYREGRVLTTGYFLRVLDRLGECARAKGD